MSTHGKNTTKITVDYLYKHLDEYLIVDWSFEFQEKINVCKSFKREKNNPKRVVCLVIVVETINVHNQKNEKFRSGTPINSKTRHAMQLSGESLCNPYQSELVKNVIRILILVV